MIPWNQAYRHLQENNDFRTLFGRKYAKDEFRYYAYSIPFQNVPPALLSLAGNPNDGDITTTNNTIDVPTTPVTPGDPVQSFITFPAGCVILGITACAVQPQRIVTQYLDGGPNPIAFAYPPSTSIGYRQGNRDLFLLQLQRSDTDNITAGNPIDEITINPTTGTRSTPIAIAEALVGAGVDSETPTNEIVVAPGLSLIVTIQSMSLPADTGNLTVANTQLTPTQTVHVCFHLMVPGEITVNQPAA